MGPSRRQGLPADFADMREIMHGQAVRKMSGRMSNFIEQSRQFKTGIAIAALGEIQPFKAAQIKSLQEIDCQIELFILRIALLGRQTAEILFQVQQLEVNRMRIIRVENDQIERRQKLGLRHVGGSVGDDAVGQFEQPLDTPCRSRRFKTEEVTD